MENINDIKQRFGIIGNDSKLTQAIQTAVEVAPIQLSVLIIGESGSGKESFPQIIHQYSNRKHKQYVAVNCGAIPEGTIDSELFGHEKGSFTGALSERKGYFEEANGGTIFLDEIGELPMQTQAKLLRVLEKGEYMRVGSSQVSKTDVRVVAATNVDLEKAIAHGKFREDLFYRLNGVLIRIPPLRSRKNDIPALFHKFTNDFADKNKIPPVRLTEGAKELLKQFSWPGNIRQLKNVAEQVTVLCKEREVDEERIMEFLPQNNYNETTGLVQQGNDENNFESEREILYKVLFDMRNEMNDLKKIVLQLLQGSQPSPDSEEILRRLYHTDRQPNYEETTALVPALQHNTSVVTGTPRSSKFTQFAEVSEASETEDSASATTDNFSIVDKERELISMALKKHNGKRKLAAQELGISERTLYRKIESYGL